MSEPTDKNQPAQPSTGVQTAPMPKPQAAAATRASLAALIKRTNQTTVRITTRE